MTDNEKYEPVTHLWGCGRPDENGVYRFCRGEKECITSKHLFWHWLLGNIKTKEDADKLRQEYLKEYGEVRER